MAAGSGVTDLEFAELATNDSHGRLLAAAVKLFARRGFHGTGIRDLATESGLSSATLYHYMGTKEALLALLMETSLGRLNSGADDITANIGDPVQCVAMLVRMHVITHALSKDSSAVVDNELDSLSADKRSLVLRQRDRYEETWQAVLAEGRRHGHFDLGRGSVTRLAVLEMCSGVAEWYAPEGALTVVELAEEYVRLVMNLLRCEAPVDALESSPHREVLRSTLEENWRIRI